MEQLDLNSIKLIDTGMYSTDMVFYNFFRKNNITTLGQLFDDKMINELIVNCIPRVRRNITNFVNIMKSKYLNVPLVIAGYDIMQLFETLPVDKSKEYRGDSWQKKYYYLTYDGTLFISAILFFGKNSKLNGFNADDFKDKKYIEYLKFLRDTGTLSKSECNQVDFFIDYYEKNRNIVVEKKADIADKKIGDNVENLEELKDILSQLINIRDNLDEQIKCMQQKIDNLSINNDKGGNLK